MTYTFIEDQNAQHLGGNVGEGDPYTHCPAVWDYMIDRFAVKSVLDVGSGMGYAAAYFHSKAVRVKVVVAHFMQPIAVYRDSTGFLRPPHRAQG